MHLFSSQQVSLNIQRLGGHPLRPVRSKDTQGQESNYATRKNDSTSSSSASTLVIISSLYVLGELAIQSDLFGFKIREDKGEKIVQEHRPPVF